MLHERHLLLCISIRHQATLTNGQWEYWSNGESQGALRPFDPNIFLNIMQLSAHLLTGTPRVTFDFKTCPFLYQSRVQVFLFHHSCAWKSTKLTPQIKHGLFVTCVMHPYHFRVAALNFAESCTKESVLIKKTHPLISPVSCAKNTLERELWKGRNDHFCTWRIARATFQGFSCHFARFGEHREQCLVIRLPESSTGIDVLTKSPWDIWLRFYAAIVPS